MVIPEKTTTYITVSFRDKNGNLAVPTSAAYSIWCLTNSQEIRASTALTPASQIEITLTVDDTAIIDANNPFEKRLLTVQGTYGAGDEIHDQYEYTVKNLRRIT